MDLEDELMLWRKISALELSVDTLKAALVELSSKLHALQDKERANG